MRRFIPALFLLGLAFGGCETAPGLDAMKIAIGIEKPLPPDPKTQMPALEQRIAVLIEEARLKIDPKAMPLVIDGELGAVARARAADMAAKNYFNHTAPNGDTSATLLMAADTQFQGLLGENMAARRYNPDSGIDIEAFAKSFVDTWLASPPHKENLSFADYNLTGVGAAVNGDTVYVTQLFSANLGMGPHKTGAPPSTATSYPDAPSAKADGSLRGTLVPASAPP